MFYLLRDINKDYDFTTNNEEHVYIPAVCLSI